MPNLNKIFNNFFPQSQTGKKGLFLLRMAWTVEISVAIIGFIIGLIIMQGTKTYDDPGIVTGIDLIARMFSNMTLSDFSFGLIFMIVAIVELTKIPLATAVYYSVRLSWKIIFILGLLLVNVSTFETIVTGFERMSQERTRDVKKAMHTYQKNLKKIEDIEIDKFSDNIDEDIDEVLEKRTKLQAQIAQIQLNAQKQIQGIKDSGANKESAGQLKRDIESLDEKIGRLEDNKSQLEGKIDSKVWGSNKNTIKEQASKIDEKISKYESERVEKNTQLKILNEKSSRDNEGQISLIQSRAQAEIKKIRDGDLAQVEKELGDLNKQKNDRAEGKINRAKDITKLQEENTKLLDVIEEKAPENQVYRVASWLRGWFEIDYNKEVTKIEKEIFRLETLRLSEIKTPNWFQKIFPIFYDDSRPSVEILEMQIKDNKERIDDLIKRQKLKIEADDSAVIWASIPQGALTAAFWLWFGVLSFVISVVGTLLAFASLVLLDPRLHKIRNTKANWRGVAERLSRLLFTIRRYIHGRYRRFKDPVIKEVKVEVEVEKIVKEPVYVYKEKIVHVEKEVPVKEEIIKKEIVYVPLPTDDEELLKKGPFVAPGEDKKK